MRPTEKKTFLLLLYYYCLLLGELPLRGGGGEVEETATLYFRGSFVFGQWQLKPSFIVSKKIVLLISPWFGLVWSKENKTEV